jgi:hypothetical protein
MGRLFLSGFQDGDHANVVPCRWKVLLAKNRVEYHSERVRHPLGGLFYWPIRYTFRAWCLGDLESSRGLFTWAGLLAQEVCVQGHVKHLSNSQMQLALNRLKLSLESSNNLVCTETPNVPTVLLTLHLVVLSSFY